MPLVGWFCVRILNGVIPWRATGSILLHVKRIRLGKMDPDLHWDDDGERIRFKQRFLQRRLQQLALLRQFQPQLRLELQQWLWQRQQHQFPLVWLQRLLL